MDNVIFAQKPRLLDVAAQLKRSAQAALGFGYKMCAVIPVAGQRTHGTTFRALKVTFPVATPGAESSSSSATSLSNHYWRRYIYTAVTVLLLSWTVFNLDVNGKQKKPFNQIVNKPEHCLHYLLPTAIEQSVTDRLRSANKLPSIFAD